MPTHTTPYGTVLSTILVSIQKFCGPSDPQFASVGMRNPTWAAARLS